MAHRADRAGVVTRPLSDALADYLALRRALGYRLDQPEKLLNQFLAYLDAAHQGVVTVQNALECGAIAHQRRVELVGLSAVDGARIRHLPPRLGPGP